MGGRKEFLKILVDYSSFFLTTFYKSQFIESKKSAKFLKNSTVINFTSFNAHKSKYTLQSINFNSNDKNLSPHKQKIMHKIWNPIYLISDCITQKYRVQGESVSVSLSHGHTE